MLAAMATALAGCDSIKDVRSEPATDLPAPSVLLKGTVKGLSSKRPLLLVNNNQLNTAVSVQAPPPSETNEELEGVTPFSFGTIPAGSAYNVTIYNNPIGKSCSVVSGGSGTLTAGVETNVVVECVNTGTRYSVTVNLDPAFAGAQGAEVVLTTEEAIYRANPAPTDTSVTFEEVLFNPVGSSQGFNWSVVASNTIGGTLNKCPVTNSTNVTIVPGPFGTSTTTITNPTGDVTNVSVGPCLFEIGGTVAYSPRTSGGAAPAAPSGLVLELRDIGENTLRTQAFAGDWGDAFTFEEDGAPVGFVSNRNAIYSVAVNRHPDGMRCVVVNPMAILYAPTLDSNPTNVTTPSVQCRELPPAERQLAGVYRHTTSKYKRNPDATEQVVKWDSLDFSKQNTASSNMLALFDNGTFIYGTHANRVQVEHGFYDYDPVAGTLTFELNADTEPGLDFPATFNPANGTSAAALTTTTPGMSALPGRETEGAPVAVARRVTMRNVDVSTPGVISGDFIGAQTQVTGSGPATVRVVEPNASMGWVLEAPPSIPMQMTGAWLAQDSRRLWVFDRETYYGTHVGVVGVYAMNDACFTMPDVSVSSGLYTRRPSIGGCYPWPRAATGQSPAYLLSGFVESVDYKFPQYIPVTATGTAGGAVDIGTLPAYMARIPGGAQAVDGRSPSPIYFHIAPAAEFFASADAKYFPPVETDWCQTEILGIRATLNAVPIHQAVYFCRFVP